jgi:maltose-binding protein MalE
MFFWVGINEMIPTHIKMPNYWSPAFSVMQSISDGKWWQVMQW